MYKITFFQYRSCSIRIRICTPKWRPFDISIGISSMLQKREYNTGLFHMSACSQSPFLSLFTEEKRRGRVPRGSHCLKWDREKREREKQKKADEKSRVGFSSLSLSLFSVVSSQSHFFPISFPFPALSLRLQGSFWYICQDGRELEKRKGEKWVGHGRLRACEESERVPEKMGA